MTVTLTGQPVSAITSSRGLESSRKRAEPSGRHPACSGGSGHPYGETSGFSTLVYDVDLEITAHRKIARGILWRDKEGGEHRIDMSAKDLVFVTNGSLTECTGYGDMDTPAPYHKDMQAGWELWRNLVRRSPAFGRPDVFCGDADKTVWQSISFNFIGRDHPFLKKIKELTGNDPLSGRTVTGGIITAEDSSWCISLTMNRQPQFHGQPEDWGVAWAYGLYPFEKGDVVNKTMLECTGEELLKAVLLSLRTARPVRGGQGPHQGANRDDAVDHSLLHAPWQG